jgi:thiosulfate dehydrogenase [quinone] large subunit
MMPRGAMIACVLARLFLGGVMLMEGLGKAQTGFIPNHGLEGFVRGALARGEPFGFFRGFLEHTVLPHGKLFACLVVGGELSIGAFLLLGLCTRLAACAGLLMMMALTLCAGAKLAPSTPVAFALLFLVVAASDAGRTLGLDGWLRRRAGAVG